MFACTAEAALFQSVDWAARRASLRQLVPAAELPAALSVQSAAFQATLVVGPAAAGLLIAHAGFALVYWLNVICFGAAFITVARLPALRPGGGGERAGLASVIGGIRYLKSSGPLAGAFLIDLGAMVFGMPRALFPAMAVTVYHGGATTVGYLNAAPGLGALIGSLLTGHVARVRRVGRAVAVCVVGWGLAITGFGLVRWLPAALLLLVLAGAADVVSSVFRMIIVQQSAPDAMQGRVNSLVFAGLQGGPRLGDAEAGVVADLAGPQVAAWSGGLLSVACAIVTCWAIPQFWRYQSTIGPARAPARGSAHQARSAGPGSRPGTRTPRAREPTGRGSPANHDHASPIPLIACWSRARPVTGAPVGPRAPARPPRRRPGRPGRRSAARGCRVRRVCGRGPPRPAAPHGRRARHRGRSPP